MNEDKKRKTLEAVKEAYRNSNGLKLWERILWVAIVGISTFLSACGHIF